jgi:hypothetical protein
MSPERDRAAIEQLRAEAERQVVVRGPRPRRTPRKPAPTSACYEVRRLRYLATCGRSQSEEAVALSQERTGPHPAPRRVAGL